MSEVGRFDGRVGLQQRVLPAYRLPFVDRLAAACAGGLEVFAGAPDKGEGILTGAKPTNAVWLRAANQSLLGGPAWLLRQPGLDDWIARWSPQVLVLEANIRYLSNWGAARLAHSQGAAVLGWGLGVPSAESGPGLRRWLWRRFLGRFDGVIGYSTAGAAQYRSLGVPADRVFVALNAAVDLPERVVQRKPATGRQLRVLFVGRLQARKRLDRLIHACAQLEFSVELRVVGDGPARAELEALAAARFPRTEFTGALRGQPLVAALAWGDLFVLPGTGGLALQQAMAHGLPVIAAEGDGSQHDLVRPDNGWLLPPKNDEALLQALRQAASDPLGLLTRGRASRRIVEQTANPDFMVRVFLQAFRRATGDA